MKTNHTKGKWKVNEVCYNEQAVIYVDDSNAIASVHSAFNKGDRIACKSISEDEAMANAKLISAAPDLLDVARKAHQWIFDPSSRGDRDVRSLLNELQEAIAKATKS